MGNEAVVVCGFGVVLVVVGVGGVVGDGDEVFGLAVVDVVVGLSVVVDVVGVVGVVEEEVVTLLVVVDGCGALVLTVIGAIKWKIAIKNIFSSDGSFIFLSVFFW